MSNQGPEIRLVEINTGKVLDSFTTDHPPGALFFNKNNPGEVVGSFRIIPIQGSDTCQVVTHARQPDGTFATDVIQLPPTGFARIESLGLSIDYPGGQKLTFN